MATVYRPPAEADSYILRIADGCPNNSCAFCGMYKGRPYHEMDATAVESEIRKAGIAYPFIKRVFLADGDAMFLSYERLVNVAQQLNLSLPNLTRISLYANSISLCGKSLEELKTLKSLKLATAYLGLESGSDQVLALQHKRDRAEDAVKAAYLARESGIRLSVMALIGAGGRLLSSSHVLETARVLNIMQPPLLSLLTLIPVPGTPLQGLIKSGDFVPLNKAEVLMELREILARFELKSTVFRCNHTSNPLPLEGRLPKDKERLIATIDAMLKSCDPDDEEVWAEPWML